MKNNISHSIATLLFACSISLSPLAQEMAGISKEVQTDVVENSTRHIGKPVTTSLLMNEISTRAIRGFNETFSTAQNVKWYKTNLGFVAYGYLDDVKLRVFYNDKGRHICTFKVYNEKRLPKEVRHQVKSTYYDYNIFSIIEISAYNHTSYHIKLEGKTSWLDVKVADNEIHELQELIKR